jgi:predicted MFS family arabinose efflux permease
MSTSAVQISSLAFRFVLIIGIANLFADMTYEGARGITGPFLGSLGASATMIGFLVGFGELAGYALRSFSGYLADRSRKYWLFVFVGYAVNMLAVPALALVGSWPVAAAFIILERTGRAIRRPATETMIAHAGKSIGRGWVFGLNEALDQTGATVGPLIVALVLYLRGSYQRAFAVLLISALLCLVVLLVARVHFPHPDELEAKSAELPRIKGFSKTYWVYFFAGALIAAGFADFALIAFHFQKGGVVPQSTIPVLYAVAMATGALSALVFGRLFDTFGLPILLLPFFLSAFFAPFVFFGGLTPALFGMVLWGIGMGAQDSLLKAVLANVVPLEKRSTAFGVFDTGFGIAWFVGSAAMGWLYDRSVLALVFFSVALQVGAVPVLFFAGRLGKDQDHGKLVDKK